MLRKQLIDILYQAYLRAGNFTKKPRMLEEHFLLTNIGLTSLSSLIFLMEIEEELQIIIQFEEFANLNTVGELIDYIYSLIINKDPE